MGRRKIGSKANSIINGEWCSHIKKFGKRYTSSQRRILDKEIIRNELKFYHDDIYSAKTKTGLTSFS